MLIVFNLITGVSRSSLIDMYLHVYIYINIIYIIYKYI